MSLGDLLRFAFGALVGHRLRTGLCLLGVTIGVAAVVLLTALGEGARRYVIDQFASLGTNLLLVLPGKTETTGTFGFGGVPNDLTLEDAQSIVRIVPGARLVAPISMGTEMVAYGERRRQVAVLGTTRDYQAIRQLEMQSGEFLPDQEMFRGTPVVVLGSKTARELFVAEDPVGRIVRVGGWRMRVVGVLARQGVKMGVDFDEIVMIPVRTAMQVFDRTSLFRVVVQAESYTDLESLEESIRLLLTERHGEEDITVVTQDAVLSTFSAILQALTLVVAAIAAISLGVAGIGIMNVMLVSVSERTPEVGLLKAVGAGRSQILAVFLAEAALVSILGGLIGLMTGFIAVRVAVELIPALPASPPRWAVAAALAISAAVGIGFGLLPAWRATRLDPVTALGRR